MDANVISVAITMMVVTGFLIAEHQKSRRYFGKKSPLTRKEKDQLRFFKENYTPITGNLNFPTIKHNGYLLEDIALSAQEVPYTPSPPKPAEIQKISAGQEVKIVLKEADGDCQRVWIQITDANYPIFRGILLNTPFDIEGLKDGDEILLHANHILQVRK